MVPVWVTVLIAFIAPAFALAGVALGAWMQRRTTREQIEAQREKDRETWRREDRHRFTSEKRVLYGEILAYIQSAEVQLARLELDHRKPEGEGLSRDERNAIVDKMWSVQFPFIGRLEIIASNEVLQLSRVILFDIETAYFRLTDRNSRSAPDPKRGSVDALSASMRADLGELEVSQPVDLHN